MSSMYWGTWYLLLGPVNSGFGQPTNGLGPDRQYRDGHLGAGALALSAQGLEVTRCIHVGGAAEVRHLDLPHGGALEQLARPGVALELHRLTHEGARHHHRVAGAALVHRAHRACAVEHHEHGIDRGGRDPWLVTEEDRGGVEVVDGAEPGAQRCRLALGPVVAHD